MDILLEDYQAQSHQQLAQAADEIVECHSILTASGKNVISELFSCEDKPFIQWEHYPYHDVYDKESRSQYYYHAHSPEDRQDAEHGHFHLFIEPKRSSNKKNNKKKVHINHHIIAISMDEFGMPKQLFTVNRWVTDELFCPAKELIPMLDDFIINHAKPSLVANRWISNMLVLFKPQIINLLVERDKVIDEWKNKYPNKDAFEDRKLELTSALNISLESQMKAIDGLVSQ